MINQSVKFLNPDGTISRDWWMFLSGLYTLTNGTINPTTPDDVLAISMSKRPESPSDFGKKKDDQVIKRSPIRDKKVDSVYPEHRKSNKPVDSVPVSHKGSSIPKLVLTKKTWTALTLIQIWGGAIANIPTGWQLCDGTNSTPDLRDKFIIGAGNTYAVAATGGSTTIATANLPVHNHTDTTATLNVTTTAVQSGAGTTVVSNVTSTAGNTGNTGSGTAYLQPYYALAYIINTADYTVVTDAKLR